MTRPKHDEQSALKDAAHVFSTARKLLPDFVKAKKLSDKQLKGFEARLQKAQAAVKAAAEPKRRQRTATRAEQEARAPLYEALIDIRDDVKIEFPDKEHAALRRDFGAGRLLDPDSTPGLVKAAADTAAAVRGHPAEARQAGIAANLADALDALAENLTGKDVDQAAAGKAGTFSTAEKDSLLRQVAADAANVRLRARRVFRQEPAKLKLFESPIARVARKPRPTPALPVLEGAGGD